MTRVHILMAAENPGLADYLWADLASRSGSVVSVHADLGVAAESCRWHNERSDSDYWVETHRLDTDDMDDVVRREYRREG